MNDVITEGNSRKTPWYSSFVPSKHFISAPSLIVINVIIFVLMMLSGVDEFSPSIESLIKWGANYRRLTLDGEQWRLLTSVFLHIGVIHLLFNLYALAFIGKRLEPVLGPLRFSLVYLCCGIAASITSIAMHDDLVSAGASGAIFGMFGVYLALLALKAIDFDGRSKVMLNLVALLAYNLVFGFFTEMVDNAAHLGGLFAGFAIALFCKGDLVKEEGYRRGYFNLTFATIGVIGMTWMAVSMIPNNIKFYEEQMRIFEIRQNQALEIYNGRVADNKEDLIDEIDNRGLYYWEENVKLLQNLKKISLPENIEARNEILEKYCNLRIKCYQLMSLGVKEETDKYLPELNKINSEIESMVSQLNAE